jgi:hypothetical protein
MAIALLANSLLCHTLELSHIEKMKHQKKNLVLKECQNRATNSIGFAVQNHPRCIEELFELQTNPID